MKFKAIIRICLLLIFISGIPIHAQAQAGKRFTISGYVKESSNGEAIIGAAVTIREPLKGTVTNNYGFFSITADSGQYEMMVSFTGLQKYKQHISLTHDIFIDIKMLPIENDVVVITDHKADENVSDGQMSVNRLEMKQVTKIPSFMGEVDVLKTIQLLPGVKGGAEGNSGFYVRGGGPDQNLVLLDEATVYNAGHLFGFFSVFNGDAIKDINLIKGGMPAQYGGRLSSVLDISMKEGNNQKLQVQGGIGVIASRLTVQGPIKKDTASFIVSARRTYIDVLMQPFIKPSSPFKGSGYYFYDLNTKLNWRINDKNRIFLSGYYGRDVFSYVDNQSDFKVSIPWGNATTSLRWNHLMGPRLFVNTTSVFTDYKFSFGAAQDGFEFKLFSGIRDWNEKVDFSFLPNNKHYIRFGANYIWHTFTPNNVSAKQGETTFDLGGLKKEYGHEVAAYINDDWDITNRWKINAGLRYSYFMQVGPFDRYIQDVTGRTIGITHYGKFKKVADYGGLEPRLSLRFIIDEKSSIKASFTHNLQYVHLASISPISLPTDIWVPCSDKVKPQIGEQYAAGYFRNFHNNMFESSVEVYYKNMRNQVEFAPSSLPSDNVNNNTDNNFIFGKGQSYGAEFFFKKAIGKLNGWVGYTLSWTTRTFPDIDNGHFFYARYDRRHDISVVAVYDLNERWSFGSIFVYGTGNAISLPESRYIVEGIIVSDYGRRNSFRMPAYHRLDVSVTYNCKSKKLFNRLPYQNSWNLSVYNAYNRHNPYFIFFDSQGSVQEGNLKVTAKQVSLFPILPSITWNFNF
ncbi:MAG: TonB-dependent receptor [Bacteroidetes bacterium]|nr:TonB-dependent receptor [Bacteroidota bacterium]